MSSSFSHASHTPDRSAVRRESATYDASAARETSLQAWVDESPHVLAQARRFESLRTLTDGRVAGGLPSALRSGVEALSGMDLSDVRVHRNSGRPPALQAHAYAQGNEIYVAPGQEKHLAHEAWHVVQQRQGRVRPTGLVGDTPINDHPTLEREADIMGERAALHGERAARPDPDATRR